MKTETKFCPKCRRYVAMEVSERSDGGHPRRFFGCTCSYVIYREDKLLKTPVEFKPIVYELFLKGKRVGCEKQELTNGSIMTFHRQNKRCTWRNVSRFCSHYLAHDWKQVTAVEM